MLNCTLQQINYVIKVKLEGQDIIPQLMQNCIIIVFILQVISCQNILVSAYFFLSLSLFCPDSSALKLAYGDHELLCFGSAGLMFFSSSLTYAPICSLV